VLRSCTLAYDRGPAGTCLTLTGIFASSQGVNSPWGSWSLTMTSAAPDLAAGTTASCVERSGRTAGPKASPVTHLACFAWETLGSARFSQIGGFLPSLIGNRLSAAPTHRHPSSAGGFSQRKAAIRAGSPSASSITSPRVFARKERKSSTDPKMPALRVTAEPSTRLAE
jgi:hypothetical protein